MAQNSPYQVGEFLKYAPTVRVLECSGGSGGYVFPPMEPSEREALITRITQIRSERQGEAYDPD